MKQIALVLLVAAALAAGGLFAQPPAGGNRPCVADRQQFCANVQPGQGRIFQCLKQNEANLSAACKQRVQQRGAQMRARGQQIRQQCRQDIQTVCANVQRGQGRIWQCLKQNEANLSAGCRQALTPPPAAPNDPIPEPVEATE